MRCRPSLAIPVAVGLALALVPIAQASAQDDRPTSTIVLDVPPSFVRYGAEMPLSGTVFAGDGRRAVKNPVTVATWDVALDEFVWGRTVVTDANGRFRTSVKADAYTGDNKILAPLLDRGQTAVLAEEGLPTVKLQYPVDITVRKTVPNLPTPSVTITGRTPECDGTTELVVETALRGPFAEAPEGRFACDPDDKFSIVVARPLGSGTVQYRVRRLPDATSVTSTSYVVAVR